ncbi:MAG: hypothetical protein ACOC44_10585 [Promethearchaeia archaeon]
MSKSYAKQRIINDIKTNDLNIQITGYIENKDQENLMLNDKTGRIKVNYEDAVGYVENIQKEDLVNVIGELIIDMDGEKSVKAQIIQNMNGLNFEYYKKLYKIKKEIE